MKLKTCAFVCLVIGFTILCGCQTDADREKDARRLRELGSRSISEFCTDPSFSEAKEIAKRGSGLAGVLVASCYEQGAGGVRADLDEAMKWYRKAQEGGYQPAANSIESLKACIAAKALRSTATRSRLRSSRVALKTARADPRISSNPANGISSPDQRMSA